MRDRRLGVRFPVQLPVLVCWRTSGGKLRETKGKTANIGCNGLLMMVPTRLRHQTPITYTISLPSAVTKVPIELIGQGKVVRQVRDGNAPGLGATMDDYEMRQVRERS